MNAVSDPKAHPMSLNPDPAAALPDADFLMQLAAAAAAQTLPRFRGAFDVANKRTADFDPVTEADQAAEKAIVAAIRQRYPTHAILGEEYGASGEGPYRWVIDPIDGTRSFISGVPLWATLVGLTVDGRARLGLVSQPFTGETFVADEEGAFLHRGGERCTLKTRTGVSLAQATLFTTDPFLYDETTKARFDALRSRARLSRYGADAYAFAMLAAGQVDVCIEGPVQPYDIVALIPLIERAGGVVTNWDGGRAEEGGSVIAAGSAALHEEVLALLNG